MPRAVSSCTLLACSARKYSTALAMAKESSCASEPPALWMMRPSATANGPRGWRDCARFHQRGKMLHGVARRRAEVEVDDDAGIELDAVEHARKRFRRRIETIAVGGDRAGHDQSQPVRTVLQILQGKRVGGGRIGMIDPLHERPSRAWGPPDDWFCPRCARIQRLDPQAVIGLAGERLLRRRPFERRLDQLAPCRMARSEQRT